MQPIRRNIIGHDFTLWHGAWLCLISALALSALGLYAIDLGASEPATPNRPAALSPLVIRQSVYLFVGIVAAALVALPHYRWVRFVSWPLMLLMLGLLVVLLIPFVPTWLVRPRNGARAWIELGVIDFQPAEAAKVAFVLVMAEYLRYRENHRTWRGLIPPALIASIPALLITLQPDLGMALLFAPTIFAMLLVAGARIRHMATVVSTALCAVALIVTIALATRPGSFPLLRTHQHARIIGMVELFRDPDAGVETINFQAKRSQMMIGAGGLWGVSDARTRILHKYNELPERHNDMILAVIMTRFGLVGGLAVLGLYALWLAGAAITAATTKDGFAQLAVVGLGTIIFAQVFINVGMAIGLLPIIGLTLPFISYGGTSLVTVWIMTGLMFGVGMRRLASAGIVTRPTFQFDDAPAYGTPAPQPRIAPGARRRSS